MPRSICDLNSSFETKQLGNLEQPDCLALDFKGSIKLVSYYFEDIYFVINKIDLTILSSRHCKIGLLRLCHFKTPGFKP